MTKKTIVQSRKIASFSLAEKLILFIGFGLVGALTLASGLSFLFKNPTPTQNTDYLADSLVIEPDRPRHLTDFFLLDQSGHFVTQKDFSDKILVVNFLFTSCSLVCPYVNAQIKKIQSQTADQPNVKFLSLSIDPNDDTVPVLAQYAQKYDPKTDHPQRWYFLTGDEKIMQRLIGTSFLDKDTSGDYAFMPGNFAHSQRIALVDTHGQIVKYFDGLNQGVAGAVEQEIKKLEESK